MEEGILFTALRCFYISLRVRASLSSWSYFSTYSFLSIHDNIKRNQNYDKWIAINREMWKMSYAHGKEMKTGNILSIKRHSILIK